MLGNVNPIHEHMYLLTTPLLQVSLTTGPCTTASRSTAWIFISFLWFHSVVAFTALREETPIKPPTIFQAVRPLTVLMASSSDIAAQTSESWKKKKAKPHENDCVLCCELPFPKCSWLSGTDRAHCCWGSRSVKQGHEYQCPEISIPSQSHPPTYSAKVLLPATYHFNQHLCTSPHPEIQSDTPRPLSTQHHGTTSVFDMVFHALHKIQERAQLRMSITLDAKRVKPEKR